MMWFFPITLLIVFELVADVLSKEYSLKGGIVLWSLAILGYVIANIFWLSALRNGSGLARGASIFSISTEIIAVLLAFYIFHEKLSNLQVTGVVLGIVALVLILM